MPNIGQVLKEEIARLAKREATSSMRSAKSAVSQHRKSIAQLKRQVAALTRTVALLQRQASKRRSTEVADAPAEKLRFVAKGLASHRARLGLSAGQFGRLVGVSGRSVYNWEAGKSTPRAHQLKLVAEVRRLGKREVQQRLAAAEGAD